MPQAVKSALAVAPAGTPSVFPAVATKPNKLLTANEAASALGVSRKTLLKWCKEKRITYIRYPGGAFKFRESTLDIFLGRNTIHAVNVPRIERTQ
jgi:excisionase family DNA binding protein